MKLLVDQSSEYKEVEILIKCPLIDDRLERLISYIRLYAFSITGKKDGKQCIIKVEDIYYFEAVDSTVFAYCQAEVYGTDLKLYEIVEKLGGSCFVQISKSCILNINVLDAVKPILNSRMEASLASLT